MLSGTSRGRALAAALTVLALLTAGLAAASTTASAAPGDRPARTSADRAQALQALSDAQALFSRRGAAAGGPATRDATMTLLRLVQTRSALTGAQRAAADRLLARPPDDRPGEGWAYACTASNCYHWATSSSDAVDPTDSNGDGVPDYVESAAAEVDGVRTTYANAGYRTPESDGTLGSNGQTDIYFADVGSQGLYGYCTSDEQLPSGQFDTWAYCVLDNDFTATQFPTNTPLENLQVTAAHEYFHAVQFAYDAFEDGWFMEATATWAEDELYDDVNDNLQYLPSGPLGKPNIPLDKFVGSHQYGDWIFFRYLTERWGGAQGGLPTLVRDMWRKADSTNGPAKDLYSLQAVNSVLAGKGSSLARAFTQFADANRRPASTYEEGAANHYPAAPNGSFTKKSGWYVTKLSHLTSSSGRFVPGSRMSKLRINFDMPDRSRGSNAVVSVYRKSGRVDTSFVTLNVKGDGAKTVPFAKASVKYVDVTLVNASQRFDCWKSASSPYSCLGYSRDDGLTAKLRGTALR